MSVRPGDLTARLPRAPEVREPQGVENQKGRRDKRHKGGRGGKDKDMPGPNAPGSRLDIRI